MQNTTLFVVPDCPLCADMQLLLKKNKIDYVVRDVTQDYAALRQMYRLTRQRLVPVVEFAGRAVVRPSETDLLKLLDK